MKQLPNLPMILACAALAGLLLNFLVSDFDATDSAASYGVWRSEVVEASEPAALHEGLPAFLGVREQAIESSGPDIESAVAAGDRHFVYEGIGYRLSGLAISDGLGAATLVAEGMEAVRITVGDTMPRGQKIESISLNEIVFIAETGEYESVRIY